MSGNPSSIISFLRLCYQLKTNKRTGWVEHNIALPESISDHQYGLAMLSWLITDPTVDRMKCIKMSLVHDLAECITGDITPHDVNISKDQKLILENNAMLQLRDTLGSETGQEFYNLWKEYSENSSPEAKLVKQLDKLEMIIQANEYETAQGKDLQSFYDHTEGVFTHPEVIKIAEELRKNRTLRKMPESK